MIHVAEDFFGGVSAIVRGGRVIFEEFIEMGKGRDMGFTWVSGFEQKISGSAARFPCRETFIDCTGRWIFQSIVDVLQWTGFFISVMQTAWCLAVHSRPL